MHPKASIVMPCYNGASHLAKSVGSVLAQTMPDWELILIDDGSTDDSPSIIDGLAAQDPRIRVVHQANAGLVATRNRGVAMARGDYVAFLDADDTWHPDFLAETTRALDAQPDAGIAYCGWQNIGLGPGRDKPYVPPDYDSGNKLLALLKGCPWPVHGALVRRSLLAEGTAFDATMTSCEDYDLWLRLGHARPLTRVPRVLAFYHHHGTGQMTQNRLRIAMNHLRAQEKFLSQHPAAARSLGRPCVRDLTLGGLMRRGYEAYWRRELPVARSIFRYVMRQGYGGPKDWLYMLPSWLPEGWHRWLLGRRDATADLHPGASR